MKRFILLFVVSLMLSSAEAQEKGKDYITMKPNGKMIWMRSGQSIQMGISVPLKDGSFVFPNGVIKKKDGSAIQMKKGDRILMDGTLQSKGNK